jgi:hypothetical protein
VDRLKRALVVVLLVAAATPAVADQSAPRTTAIAPILASAAPSPYRAPWCESARR